MAKQIHFHALAVLHEQGLDAVNWGDGVLTEIATRAGVRSSHPLRAMKAVLAALERSPDYFEKLYLSAHDCRGRPRRVRQFRVRCIN